MEKWYSPVIAWMLFLLLAASFIMPAIRLLRRIRSSGVSKDTHQALAMNFAWAMVISVALTIYTMISSADDRVFYWTVSGMVGLMLTHLETLRVFLKDNVDRKAVE
jgi:hypothetical protein